MERFAHPLPIIVIAELIGLPIEDREEASAQLAGEHEHQDHKRAWQRDDSVHDLHSAIGAIRAWHSAPGDTTTLPVELGGGHFELELTDAGRELHAGKPAVRYTGLASRQPFVAWLSDDEARVPLTFRCDTPIGAVAVDLVAYDVSGD